MNTTLQPLVTVATPVYNGAEYLAECIESVLSQSYDNFEYIVVNNCSKDRTLEIAQHYAEKDRRVRVHDNTEFLPVMANHNLACSLMSPHSKYLKLVSADDWIFPECLTKMVGLAEAHPNVGLVGSYSIAGKQIVWDGLEYERQTVSGAELSRATLLGGPYVFGAPTTLLYRADIVRRTPEFYPNPDPHSDTTACYGTLETSDFGFVHQVLSYTRIHAESETSNSARFGLIKRAVIRDLLRFGPKYLSAEELKGRLNFLMDKYYEWLVPAMLENSMNKDFFEKQKTGLSELGLQLSVPKISKAALLKGLDFVRHPRAAIKEVADVVERRGKIQARYY